MTLPAHATILIVEDNPMNMELATDLLEAAGYTVRQAFSAEEGIRLAQDERPDLILMDIRLPGMDGHAAIRALKQDPATAGIRTVALTAQAMKGDEETALVAGFDGYIAKPIDTRTFQKAVAQLLGTPGSPP
jgi:CheY-like chemotaxis protein